VATRTNPVHEADRYFAWQLLQIGREIRLARIMGGRTQVVIARAVGTSAARMSRIERGKEPAISAQQLARIGAACGLKISLRAFPAGRRLLDQPQLDLLARLRDRAHPSWRWATEVPMPIAGDLRAGDAVSRIPGCSILWELWTRLADVQAQTRGALLTQRDLQADRLVLVLKATRANREALRQADPRSLASFSRGSRPVLRALRDGRDPGGNGIVLL
jgi:transcriptional regulator with XRE-family HTH domain